MARMQRPSRTVPQQPKSSTVIYKGYTIETVEQDTGSMVYAVIGETKRRARDFNHAMSLIDSIAAKAPEGPFGGYMKNPPAFCKKIKTDKDGQWVECVVCAFHCKDNAACPVYLMIQEGAKVRMKLMNTNPLAHKCPYCEAPIHSKGDVETVYSCTTTGNRLEQAYIKKCGLKPTTTNRRRR